MLQFPPIPSWSGAHPLIIHFPIALLMIAPVLVVLGLFFKPEKGRMFMIAALVLLLIGTASVFVAVETGEAAGELADRTPQINAILERHEALAERTRLLFSVLTVVFAALVFLPKIFKREQKRAMFVVLPIVFLLFYSAGIVSLVNTAHQGGTLVHQYGVHAIVAPGGPASVQDAATQDHDD